MRLLANESFPRVAVEALRAEGHDVAWIRTDSPGIPDEEDEEVERMLFRAALAREWKQRSNQAPRP